MKTAVYMFCQARVSLSSFSADTSGKLNILGHDGHSLGVDGAQVSILKESDEVSLASFLEGHNGRALKTQVGLEILCNFTDQTLERKLPDQKLSTFLVPSDLTKSDSSWPVSVRFLDTTGGWGALTGGLGSQLFPWGFASS